MSWLTNTRYNTRYLVWIIILVATTFYVLNFNSFQVGTYFDDAWYIILAQSIATGQGYSRINYPVPQPELGFPAGYPLLISPIVALQPFNFTLLKIFSMVLTLVFIFLLKKYLDCRTSSVYSLLIIALYAVNMHVVGHATLVMSEPAFILWIYLGLFLFYRFLVNQPAKWHQILILAFVLAAASMTRLLGGSLAIACIICLLLYRQIWASILLGVFYFCGMIPHFMLSKQAGGSFAPLHAEKAVGADRSFETFFTHLQAYIMDFLPEYGFGVLGPSTESLANKLGLFWVIVLLEVALLVVILIGLLRMAGRGWPVGEIFFLLYVFVLGITTTNYVDGVTPRYLIPLLPLIYLYFIEGIDWIVSKITLNPSRSVMVTRSILVACVVLFLLFSVRNIRNFINPISNRIPDISLGANWIANNAKVDDVVMVHAPGSYYLHTRRLTTDFPVASDQQEILQKIEQENVSFIILSPRLEVSSSFELDDYQKNHLLPALQQNSERFKVVYENRENSVFVYQVINNS